MLKQGAIFLAAGLGLALLAGGCGLTLGRPADALYLPDYDILPEVVQPGPGPSLRVADVKASFGLNQKSMLYREGPEALQVQYRRDSEWLVLPTELVARKFREHALVSDRIGFAYEEKTTGVEPDYNVQLLVTRFDEVHEPSGWSAVFGVDVTVFRLSGPREERLVGMRHLPVTTVPAARPEPADVVRAMSEAIRQGLDRAVAAVADMIGSGR